MRLAAIWAVMLLAGIAWTVGTQPVEAQTLTQRLRKAYSLPEGYIQPGDRKRVGVRDHNGALVAAQVYVRIGDEYLLQMPNGRLAKIAVDDVRFTNAPFRPANRERMKLDLRRELGDRFKVAESKNYLFFYTCSDAYQQKACDILEAVHSGIYKYFEDKFFAVHKPDVPLVAIIFKNAEEFRQYGRKADSIDGYYDQLSNYAVFYEESELTVSSEEAARDEMLSTVAHEGVHQTLCNIGVQPRLAIWPIWVIEGLAEFFAPTIDGKSTEWKGVGQINDIRLGTLEPFFKAPAKNRGYIKTLFTGEEIDADGYAFAWGMVHYLNQEKPASLMQYLRSLSARTPLEPPSGKGTYAENELAVFERYFNLTPGEVEIDLAYHLRKLPFEHPWQNLTHYVAIAEYAEGAFVKRAACMCLVESKAEEWRTALYQRLTPEQRSRATFYIKTLSNRDSAKKYAYRWLNPPQ